MSISEESASCTAGSEPIRPEHYSQDSTYTDVQKQKANHWYSLSYARETGPAGKAEIMPPPPHRRLTSSTEDVIC